MSLSNDELHRYSTQGFILKRGIIAPERATLLGQEIENLHESMARSTPADVHASWEEGIPADHPKRIRQLMNSEKVSPVLDAISKSDGVLSIMRQLIGPDVYLYHSKLMMKAARDGTFTPWHQDWGYWRHAMREPSQVNCMLAIDPNIAANGALRFVEGSHKRGPIDHKEFASASFNIGLDGDINQYDSVMVEMQPGDAVFFGPLVIHGSAANTSDMDRRANTFAFDKPANHLRPEHALPSENWRCGMRTNG